MQTPNASFENLLRYLKEERGFDFTGYKRTSLMRRIQHQMQRLGIEDFEDYLDYLQVHPEEFTSLFNTILINVTSFFRDPEAWEYLREEVAPAVVQRNQNRPIRLWSAGCASGQEAYGLAMCLSELMSADEFRQRVKVYATDVDEDSLIQARAAAYDEREVRELPPDLVEKYFERSGSRYVFTKDLRRSVIFGRNDLVQDAPISRIDILACRNTLMYFNAEAQARILSRLHFALNPDGVLFLGKAEMLLSHTALFRPIDVKRRFFAKVDGFATRDRAGASTPVGASFTSPTNFTALREEALLNSPTAQIIVDAEGAVGLVNQRAVALLAVNERDIGRPFRDLEVSYRPVELRAAIEEARSSRLPVWIRGVPWMRPGQPRVVVDVQVHPLLDVAGRFLGVLVTFHDVTRSRELQDELENANRQLETAYEELQSTNEELETTNEELQSTNEELETMNEELQSMNDELHVTNVDLQQRTDEISRLNLLLQSILAGLRAGVVVVDPEMRVRIWNDVSEDLWGVRGDEAVGEHLLSLDFGLPLDEVKTLVRGALSDGGSAGQVVLAAVNRRGRPVSVTVTVKALRDGALAAGTSVTGDGGMSPSGALLLMEAQESMDTET